MTQPPSRAVAAGARGTRPGAVLAIVVAAGIAALASTPGVTRAAGTIGAPACIPASLDHSARLAGAAVDVTPAPGTNTADPDTQISFLGAPASEIRGVRVVGARSGAHSGQLEAYSQGDGASFVPAKPFTPGEQVMVRVTISGTSHEFSFGVDTPWSTAGAGGFPNPTPPSADYQTFVTMSGVQAPVLTVTTPDHDPAAGDILTTNGPAPGRYGAFIFTPQGRLVWDHQLSGGMVADDLNLQSYDGERDLTLWQGKVLSLGFGQGEDIVMNSHYQTVATVKGGNGLKPDLHEFQIAPHDIAYVTAYNPIRCDLHAAQGPRNGVILDAVILEIDMHTGLVRWEWHALDHVSPNESETLPPSGPWDWFHINSIDPQSNGDVFISARNTWTGYELQAGTGNILWRLGGLKSSFKMGPGTATAWQHDGRILPNGDVTFFDDGSDPTEPGHDQSRGVTIALDFATHTARLVSSLTHPGAPLLAASQGDMQTLADGNSLVGFGGVPEISEFSKSGTLLFDAHLPYDMIFYRAYRAPWSAQPLSAPAVAANFNNVGETIVHMSWNGATGVAEWRILAGKRAASLTPQATIPDSGFESSTVLTSGETPGGFSNASYVAVEALSSSGHVLATSHTVRIASYASADPKDGGRA